MMKTFLLSFFIFFQSSFLVAQTCCSGGIPLSNNIGLAILEKGAFQIGINYDYNFLNTLNNRTEKLSDNSRLRTTRSVLLNFSYSFTNNFSLEGLLSWVNQKRQITQFGNENNDETSGVGDGVVLLKYGLNNVFGERSFVNVGIGTKVPMGSSTETNKQGITLNADLQPGSNAWDLIYWSEFSRTFNFRPSFNFSTKFIYRSTGINNSYFGDSSYKFGNEMQLFLGFSDQFLLFEAIINPSLSFKYRNANQDEIGGFQLENTGGNWVSVIPNFSINIRPNIILSTKAEIPVYSNVDGTQLTPTFRITTGFLFVIPSKNEFQILN